jgi:hypothetical protein
MERRYLPNVHDRGKRNPGAFCTRWEGWNYPDDLGDNITHRGHPKRWPERGDCRFRVPEGSGVYALLYHPSRYDDSKAYVLYVGVAGSDLWKESIQTRKRFAAHWHTAMMAIVFASTKATNQADSWEYHLIRYYCPPWNTRFMMQGRRSLSVGKTERS